MNFARKLGWRIYQDLLMGSRLDEYRRLLRHLRDLGYRFRTMSEYALNQERDSPICLLRNDIDSDPAGAARMFGCDRDESVRATYYFRLGTLDPSLIREIVAHGSEVGYHYEEIASFARRAGIASREQIEARMDEVRALFRDNVHAFRARTNVAPLTVASHGDFINRRLGLPNHGLLTPALMHELCIIADAYDYQLHAALDARFVDLPAPDWWRPANPLSALSEKPAAISILVHPRQWHCSPALNLRLGIVRVAEELTWFWKTGMRRNTRPAQSASLR